MTCNDAQQQVPLSGRELATITCALSSIQDRFDGFPSRQCHAPESAECRYFAEHRPLSGDEIDELCERIPDCRSASHAAGLGTAESREMSEASMPIHVVSLNLEGDQVGIWATVHAEKADALTARLEDDYGNDDVFVGVYRATAVLEHEIDTGPTNPLGIPLITRDEQQPLF